MAFRRGRGGLQAPRCWRRLAVCCAALMAAALAAKMPASASSDVAVVWFRKCLRLHDNAALVEASKKAKRARAPASIDDFRLGLLQQSDS